MSNRLETAQMKLIHVPAEGDRLGHPCLVIIYGPDLGRKIDLDTSSLTIGRDSVSDVVVALKGISRRHCTISRGEFGYRLEDLESTNGTHVNDRELEPGEVVPLSSGDHIHLPGVVIKFLDGSNVEALYHEEIYRMTIVDGLTRVYNRRYLQEFLGREIARCRRHNRPLALILFDVDHFKRINDERGHVAGDHVLRELSKLARARIRHEECLARFGGDEFAVVIPETPLEGVRNFAERLRELVSIHPFSTDGNDIEVTISLGLAELTAYMHEPDQLIQAADANLYAAKDAGRNTSAG